MNYLSKKLIRKSFFYVGSGCFWFPAGVEVLCCLDKSFCSQLTFKLFLNFRRTRNYWKTIVSLHPCLAPPCCAPSWRSCMWCTMMCAELNNLQRWSHPCRAPPCCAPSWPSCMSFTICTPMLCSEFEGLHVVQMDILRAK